MIKNRKGEVERVITALPVLLFVSLIMIGFLIFTSLISLEKPSSPEVLGLNLGEGSVLLEEIEFNGTKMPFLNFLILIEKGSAKNREIQEVIKGLLENGGGSCFYYKSVTKSSPSNRDGIRHFFNAERKDGGKVDFYYKKWSNERDEFLSKFNFVVDGKNVNVLFYRGDCDFRQSGKKGLILGNPEVERE